MLHTSGAARANRQKIEGDMIEHYLLTKFNLPLDYARYPGQHDDPAWLAHRWTLFAKYCLPSVLNQTDTDFIWVIYCAASTPEPYISRLKCLAEGNDQVRVVSLETTTHGEHFAKWAVGRGDLRAPYILTTRLDNDDAMSTHYMGKFRAAALRHLQRHTHAFTGPHLWNVPIGYQVADGKYYLSIDPNGPFLSMLERADSEGIRTILSLSHRDAGRYARTYVFTRPAWLQVVHEENLINELTGVRVPIHPEERFGLEWSPSSAPEPFLGIAREIAATATRWIRRAVLRIVRTLSWIAR
jgi:hypothetical protein